MKAEGVAVLSGEQRLSPVPGDVVPGRVLGSVATGTVLEEEVGETETGRLLFAPVGWEDGWALLAALG
jgi:hypothetical protein